MFPTKKLLIKPLIILAAIFAVACTSSDTPTSNESTRSLSPSEKTAIASGVPTPTPTPVITVAPAGKSGGVLTVAASADIPHRDVHQEVQETLTALGPGLAYSRLLRLRSGEGANQPNLLLECDLCQSWVLTEDLMYQFRLRPDVLWQNVAPVNGRALTAQDVVFSLDRIKTPDWPNAPLLASIGKISAIDDRTLQIELSLEDADALLALADGHIKVVAPEVVAEYGDLKDAPVIGTGPWVWQEAVPNGGSGEGMKFLRNPDYFEDNLPFLDGLNIVVMRPGLFSDSSGTGESDQVAAFRAGLIDVLSVGPGEWETLRGGDTRFQSVVSRRSGAGVMLAMNTQTPALTKTAVRQAVFQAIDPWDYLDTVWSGLGFTSVGIPVREPGWLLDREDMRRNYFADPGKARRLLANSGQKLPVDIEVTVRIERTGGENLALEKKLLADLTAVGFNPELRRMNPVQFNDLVMGPAREFQLAVGAAPPTSTTNSFLFGLLHSQGQWNMAGHQDTQLDSMIEVQAAEFDDSIRKGQLVEIQRRVLEQAYLFSPVTAASRWVFREDLKGFEPNTALSEYNFWSRAWLDR
ncbi:MAG: ABC transporter substrate-binding protein [Chloroflexi bacterium]|nr:ABC transporter substrate-binding protein [Chloroflexota bacterium]MDA1270216.1 ABC transporter substrate-binding protein [Chloroflexota bacterium]